MRLSSESKRWKASPVAWKLELRDHHVTMHVPHPHNSRRQDRWIDGSGSKLNTTSKPANIEHRELETPTRAIPTPTNPHLARRNPRNPSKWRECLTTVRPPRVQPQSPLAHHETWNSKLTQLLSNRGGHGSGPGPPEQYVESNHSPTVIPANLSRRPNADSRFPLPISQRTLTFSDHHAQAWSRTGTSTSGGRSGRLALPSCMCLSCPRSLGIWVIRTR